MFKFWKVLVFMHYNYIFSILVFSLFPCIVTLYLLKYMIKRTIELSPTISLFLNIAALFCLDHMSGFDSCRKITGKILNLWLADDQEQKPQ